MSVVKLPGIRVTVDGTPLAGSEARALGAIRVQQRLSLPTLCELTFHDLDGVLAEGLSLQPGSRLRVDVHGYPQPLFVGQATAVEYLYGPHRERQILVRGYDVLHQLRKRQPVAMHVQVTLAELARSLVADLGLAVDMVADGVVQQQLLQYRQSDLELLTEVAERDGIYFTVRDDVLVFLTLAGYGEPAALRLGDKLLEARIEINSDRVCRSVAARGWDPWHAESHRGSASSPRVGRRVGARLDPSRVGGSGQRAIVDTTVQGDAQAEGIAQAELDRRVASEVTLWGMAEGDPGLRPGTPVEVEGVAGPVTGRYILTSVTHVIDRRQGFLSEIDTAPPAPRTPVPVGHMTLGRVTQVADPEGLGRVRVMLPNYDNLETGWLAVVVPGAGNGKGLIALPDIDDRVLLLFANGEPAQGVVVGGLYGTEAPPDAGIESGAVRRCTLMTPGGQRIVLDDAGEKIRLENSDGGFLELSSEEVRLGDSLGSEVHLTPECCRIHAATRLEIEAPGESIVIRGQSVDFEKA